MKKGFVEGLCKAMNEMDEECVKGANIRYEFTPKQWIIFDLQNGDTAIGYTQIRESQPVIVYTSDAGETGVLPYDQIVNPRRLFVESCETNNIRHSVVMLPDVYINFAKGEA